MGVVPVKDVMDRAKLTDLAGTMGTLAGEILGGTVLREAKSQKKDPFISVIVLNWNGRGDSLECLQSLRGLEYPAWNVIFADNGSVDGSIEAVREAFPEVVIVENGANLGYAEGNNRAIRFALEQGADAVLVLNNDTIVDPGLLQAFVDAEAALPNAGMLGAVSFLYNEPETIAAAGGMWDASTVTARHVAKRGTVQDLPSQEPYEVDYVVGCALYASRNVLSKVGLLEPLFFLNGEDVDWCFRAKKAGFRNYTIPSARIWHKVAVSFGGGSPIWRYFMTRNALLWTQRHLPASQHRAVVRKNLREILPPMKFLTWKESMSMKDRYWALTTWVRQVRSPRGKAEILARTSGIYHFFRKRFGDCPEDLRKRLTPAERIQPRQGSSASG